MILQAADGPLAGALPSWGAAAVLGLGALALLVGLALWPARRRPFLAVGALACALLAGAHAAAALDVLGDLGLDADVAAGLARVGAYALALPLALGVLGRVAGYARGLTATLAVAALGHAGGIAGWLLLDAQQGLAALGAAAAFAAIVAYLAVDAAAGAPAGPRRLCCVRLVGVVGLAWGLAALALGLSPLGVGVLDGPTATFLGGYLDAAFGLGVGGLLLASGDGLDAALAAGDDAPSEVADERAGDAADDPASEERTADDADASDEEPAVDPDVGAGVAEGGPAAGDGGTVPDASPSDDE